MFEGEDFCSGHYSCYVRDGRGYTAQRCAAFKFARHFRKMNYLINSAPVIHRSRSAGCSTKCVARTTSERKESVRDPIDPQEVFDHIKDINDPEHPYSLEQLDVVSQTRVHVDDVSNRICVSFTPTVPHCSMATLIGLSIRVKLLRVLPRRMKIDISISPGSHSSELAVNKQLNDKERVAAALENANLLEKVNLCLKGQTAM